MFRCPVPGILSGGHMNLDRMTHNPDVMGGKACIRGMRVTVGMIVGQVGTGRTIEQVLIDFPYLEREDVLQALRYAAQVVDEDLAENGSEWLELVESLDAPRTDVGAGNCITMEEHQKRNADRSAAHAAGKLPACTHLDADSDLDSVRGLPWFEDIRKLAQV
jgi:uncharacterized protein (DUF433 family)